MKSQRAAKQATNLIHAGIGEEQSWILVRDGGRGGNKRVVFFAEETKEFAANPG